MEPLNFYREGVMVDNTTLKDEFPIAMAYVPNQTDLTVFEVDKGFCTGTIFTSLDKPFMGGGAK